MSNATHREIIESFVTSIPKGKKFTSTEVSKMTGLYPGAVSHHFTELWRDGVISRVGSERAHKRKRYVYVNAVSENKTSNAFADRLAKIAGSHKKTPLSMYTDEEILAEVARRAR